MTSGLITIPEGELPPKPDTIVANFIEGEGYTYALVGKVFRSIDELGVPAWHWMMGQGVSQAIPDDMVSLYDFFSTPTTEVYALEWLKWAGASKGFLDQLVRMKILVRIDATTALTASKSLHGVILVSESLPGEEEDGQVGVISQVSSILMDQVSLELASVMWKNNKGFDIPKAIKKINFRENFSDGATSDKELFARRAIEGIPRLLLNKNARLEWKNVHISK